MPKRKKRTSDKVVPHPRFGDAFIPSGFHATEQMVRDSFWAYKDAKIFAASAIPADVSQQNFTTFPRGYYVDILKLCRDCKRNFIFFAKEQRYWFEELGFYVDADCVRCCECRVNQHELKQRFQRYSETIVLADPSCKTLADSSCETLETLVDDVVVLWSGGLIHNQHKLRRIRNLANEVIPACSATQRINSLVKTLDPDSTNSVEGSR